MYEAAASKTVGSLPVHDEHAAMHQRQVQGEQGGGQVGQKERWHHCKEKAGQWDGAKDSAAS